MSGETCSLQVRLFDGTSIRSKFSSDATLSTSVRTFVTENSSDETPFNFRLMDLPRPSRTIEISEEGQSLKELGLSPGATLVLVPVKDFTDAYAASGVTGMMQKGVNMGLNMAYGAFGMVGSAITSATGYGGSEVEGPYIAGTGEEPEQISSRKAEKAPAADGGQKPGIRITTLADQRRKEDTEFYNGNQLSVEPRPEDKK